MAATPDPLVKELESLLDAGKDGREDCPLLVDMLPQPLKGLIGNSIQVKDVIRVALVELFQRTNSTFVRAGREYLAMTRHDYRAAHTMARRYLDGYREKYQLRSELPSEATPAQEQAALESLLRDVTFRRILAGYELKPGIGQSTKTTKETSRREIAKALADELRTSLRDQSFIDAVGARLNVSPCQAPSSAPSSPTPIQSPPSGVDPPVDPSNSPTSPLPVDASPTTPTPLPQQTATRRRRAPRTGGQDGSPSGDKIVRGLVYRILAMALLFTSLPLAARLLPPFVSPHFLQLVDDALVSTVVLAVTPMLGLFVGFLMWLDAYEEPRRPSFARVMAWFLVFVLAVGNVAARLMYHEAATQVATSINSQIASWQPVILDNGTFDNSAQSCQEPTTTRYGQIPLVFEFAGGPDSRMAVNVDSIPHMGSFPGEWRGSDGRFYVYVDRSVSAGAYQCSIRNGLLSTRLSLPSDDLMVMYPVDDGKSVGPGAYYIETEVRPIDGSHLSSCVLATARFNVKADSPGPTAVFSVFNAIDNGIATYQAKVYQAISESGPDDGSKVNKVVQSGYLPFVLHDTPLDNFDGWVKFAVYKSNGTVDFLVNDRVVATFADPDTATGYPQLGTRAGTATAGGAAACEFRYLRAYSSG
jgi:hypothetical protein